MNGHGRILKFRAWLAARRHCRQKRWDSTRQLKLRSWHTARRRRVRHQRWYSPTRAFQQHSPFSALRRLLKKRLDGRTHSFEGVGWGGYGIVVHPDGRVIFRQGRREETVPASTMFGVQITVHVLDDDRTSLEQQLIHRAGSVDLSQISDIQLRALALVLRRLNPDFAIRRPSKARSSPSSPPGAFGGGLWLEWR